MLITLTEWDKKCFSKTHGRNTLSKWARQGLISPAPIIVGKAWMVQEDAVYVPPDRSTAQKLKQAQEMLNNEPLGPIDARVLEILNGSQAA